MKKLIYITLANSLLCAEVITSIDFEGLQHLSKEQAKRAVGINVGETVDLNMLNEATKRLYSYGYFESIDVDMQGYALVFKVKEKNFIAKIDIKGASTNDKKQIKSFLDIKKGEAYNEKKIKDVKEKIILFYQSKGFYDSVVEIETTDLGNGAIALDFNINRGETVTIKKLNLVGANKLGYSDFEPEITNKEKELLGWFWGFNDGKLRSFALFSDPDKIKQVYLSKGYLDANVSDGYLEANMQNYTANLTYYISEGERYTIKSIEIENPLENELKIDLKELNSKANKYIDIAKIRQDTELVKTKFQDLGYALAEVYPDISQDKENHEARVVFKVKLNDKYRIGDVVIKGNDRTLDRIVRRELLLTEGMVYNQTKLNQSIIALKKTGYFESVNIIPQPSYTNNVDLLVEVKERRTGSITGGVGYSTENGLLLNGSVSDRNIFGSGLHAGISLQKSDKDITGRVFLNNPRIFDSRYSLGGSIYSYKKDWDTYQEYNKGFDLSLGRELNMYWSVGLRYNLEQSDLRKATHEMLASGYKLDTTIKSAITPYVFYDSTDDYAMPRNGIYSRLAFEYVGVGGDQKYKKLSFDFKYYKGFQEDYDLDLIFRFRTSFNKLFNYENTPINSRLYLGGLSSIRGFEADTVNPRGSGKYNGVTYNFDKGGGISLASSVELNFPLINKLKLRGSIFYDNGMIGEYNLNEINRQSVGFSLDWNTPMGPLTFVFSKPLNKKAGDKTENFSFSIGSQF